MQEHYETDFNRVLDLAIQRDYGQAMYLAFRLYVSASMVNPDYGARAKSHALLSKLDQLIEIEFEEFARRNGINWTSSNKKDLMRRHSKHWKRFDSFMYPGVEPYGLRYIRVPITLSPN